MQAFPVIMRVDVELAGRVASASPRIGRSKWKQGCSVDWDEALGKLRYSLCFNADWATAAMRNPLIRECLW